MPSRLAPVLTHALALSALWHAGAGVGSRRGYARHACPRDWAGARCVHHPLGSTGHLLQRARRSNPPRDPTRDDHDAARAAASTGVRNAQIVQDDGQQIPLPSWSFDLVFLVDVVGEVPDKAMFFKECAQVLKPNGILTVTGQINDPDFRLPSTIYALATEVGLGEEGREGLPWCTYTVRYRKQRMY